MSVRRFAKKRWRIALRPHSDRPAMDDIVAIDVSMVHIEQMDNKHWWMSIDLRDVDGPESLVLHFTYRRGEIECHVGECPDVLYEEGSVAL